MGQNLGIGQSIGQNPGNGNNGNNGMSNPGSNGGIVTNGYSGVNYCKYAEQNGNDYPTIKRYLLFRVENI